MTNEMLATTFSPLFIAALTATNRSCSIIGAWLYFQSAFHRGTHCYRGVQLRQQKINALSVRFSSRHSLLPRVLDSNPLASSTFSPLFIAALTATKGMPSRQRRFTCFQSAFHRGTHCYLEDFYHWYLLTTFSPLFIAALTATKSDSVVQILSEIFQSAFHRGTHCYKDGNGCPNAWVDFQSAFHRGTHCYKLVNDTQF